MTGRTGSSWWRRLLGRIDDRLPKPPQDRGDELSRDEKLILWEIENDQPVGQGRSRSGGQGGFR